MLAVAVCSSAPPQVRNCSDVCSLIIAREPTIIEEPTLTLAAGPFDGSGGGGGGGGAVQQGVDAGDEVWLELGE